MKIGIFTDPHLGKVLSANTTLESRKRLQNDLYSHVKGIMQTEGVGEWFCLGDLLDKYQNTEATFLQALDISSRLELLMAGNHDVVNDVTRIGTMQTLQAVLPAMRATSDGDSRIRRVAFNESGWSLTERDNCSFFVVPHHSRDELFEEAIAGAEDTAGQDRGEKTTFLLLHCNYDMEFACNDVTLNLSRQRASKLLDTFDFILIGHDHRPKEDFNGRVIVLGNTHPTGFGDISDKRIAIVDSETGTLSFESVWQQIDGYAKLEAQDLLGLDLTQDVHLTGQFIDIVGTLEADQAMDFAKAMKKLWGADRTPYAIRANVHLAKAGVELTDPEHPAESAWDLIRAELQAANRADLLAILDSLKAATVDVAVEE